MTPTEGSGTVTPFGRTPNAVGGAGNGVIGGRPVLPSEGRATGAVPRGLVIGGEGIPARSPIGPIGRSTAMASPTGRPAGAPGMTPGVRPLPSSSGIVGGQPTSNSGVVAGNAGRQLRRQGARVQGPGAIGTGETAQGNAFSATRYEAGRGSADAASHRGAPARNGNSRPYGVTEDEETWRRNHRPTVPPVVG